VFTKTSCGCPGHGIKINLSSDRTLSIDAVTFPPAGALIFKGLWCYLPEWILPWMAYLPAKQLRVFRRYMEVARRVASQLLDDVCREMVSGQNNRRDVMSLMGAYYVSPTVFHNVSQDASPSKFHPGPQTRND
jgi:hypothetical protein